MKRILKVFALLVFVAIIFILANLLFINRFKTLKLPELEAKNRDFGEVIDYEQKEETYEIYSQKLDSIDYISSDVNAVIDSQIKKVKENAKTDNNVRKYEKAAYKNVIDTYKVNDRLYSVRVTSMMKKNYEEE